MNNKIIDVFYNQIVNEAKNGIIDCYFNMNIIFDLVINNNVVSKCTKDSNEILIPTLNITNKELFDSLLIEYVNKAINFYDKSNFNFLNDINNEYKENINDIKETYLIKYIICTLLANASYSDFNDPINFLKTRISMFDNKILQSNDEINIGYIESIGANLYIYEEKSLIRNETPYKIKSYLLFNDGYNLAIPDIFIGSDYEKYYLYAIQGKENNDKLEEKVYLKQIRKGFVAKIKGLPEHYFIASMIALSLCKDKNIECVPFLIERWNAKSINIEQIGKSKNIDTENMILKQEEIQSNVTNKLIQYFTKLKDVSIGLNFNNIPFEVSDKLSVYMDSNFESKSDAFNEIYFLISKYMENNFNNKI